MHVFGLAPRRVIDGGLPAYLTDPLFLLEPLLVGAALIHWIGQQDRPSPQLKMGLIAVAGGGVILFAAAFLMVWGKTIAEKCCGWVNM